MYRWGDFSISFSLYINIELYNIYINNTIENPNFLINNNIKVLHTVAARLSAA